MQETSANQFTGRLSPVMLTPFNADNSIDFKGLKTLTDFYISTGANGLFTNCLSSEMYWLTEAERIQLTKAVVAYSDRRVPVISTGSFYHDTNKNIEFIKKIYDQGVDAVILISSILVDETESEAVLKSKLEKILKSTGNIPLGMYECPEPYKRLLSTEMMKWLVDTERFIYHKDTSCQAHVIKAKIEAAKGSCLKIYNAHIPDALESIKDGACGLSPISANFFPELYALFLRLLNAGDFLPLQKLNDKMIAMDFTVHQLYYPWAAKAFLNKRGLDIQTYTRVPESKIKKKNMLSLDVLYEEVYKVYSDFEVNGIHIP